MTKYINIKTVFKEKLIGITFYIARLCAKQNSKCYIMLVNKETKDLSLKIHYIIKYRNLIEGPHGYIPIVIVLRDANLF